MEQRLAEFRARRQAVVRKDEETAAQTMQDTDPPTDTTPTADTQQTEEEEASPQSSPSKDSGDWSSDSASGKWSSSKQVVCSNLTLLKVSSWSVLLGLFAESEFGSPFFVISLFYWLYEGLRSPAAREPGESSAYSVFNPDCQPSSGSLTAEQSEGEMGYRPSANR